jgi:hypothetical protein
MADIFVSRGTTRCNANVDLLCSVCDETVGCTKEDVYIKIDTFEDRAKCRQICRA